jgi:hypothetical protein
MSFLLSSGQIQLPTQGNNTTTTTTTTTTSNKVTISDINISPVSNTIDPSLYVYDGQTVLYINSTVNQTNNSVVLQYFDPVAGYPYNAQPSPYGYPSIGSSNPFTNWNFDLTPQNYLNGCVTSSNLIGEQTYLYDNLQPPVYTPNYLGQYSIDITNANQRTDSSGFSDSTMFFSLTSQPYLCYQGQMYNSPNVPGAPTPSNINPNYSSIGTDTFLFTSQYWIQTNNEILIIQMVFSIANTSSTYFPGGDPTAFIATTPAPIVNVTVYNKVISREMLASIGTGNPCPKPKVYSSGVISLKYLQTGQTFQPGVASYFLFNNVPVVIADGFTKQFATFGVYYIPPGSATIPGACQYLSGASDTGTGYTIVDYLPQADTGATGIKSVAGTTLYGHFVVSVAYSYNASQYNPGTVFTAEVLVKNIWRSPISIYSAYSSYSVNDLVNKQVVLLFGKTSNGGTFLVSNTGTPLSQVTNYGVCSLGNFMLIMKTLISTYADTYNLADYFVNATLINNLNSSLGVNIQTVLLQPILEGTMTNPPSVLNCPHMWYMFLNAKNSANLSIDPTNQITFNSDSSVYLGLSSTALCDTGLCKYFNSELQMLGTNGSNFNVPPYYFGNSLYMGLNVINGVSYYMLLILPEALFNGVPANTNNNNMSIYATKDSVFYFMVNASTSSAFTPSSNTVSSSSSSAGNANSVSNNYSVSKIILPVSNVQLIV